MSTATPTADSEIFTRVISAEGSLTPGLARSILAWKFPESDIRKIRRLQKKNDDGTISDAERSALESYVRVGHFVAVMQAKARLSLKSRHAIA